MSLNPKKLFLPLLLIACVGHCFSQPRMKKNFLPADTMPKLPALISPIEKNVPSSLRRELNNSLFDTVKNIKSSILNGAKNIYQNPFTLVDINVDYNGLSDSSYLY